ncbi:MAG: phosphopantetheine-binding protein, partial [Microcoleaceae cyanobacterium]
PNGKVDRKALPKPDTIRLDQENYVAPGTELEEKIAEIWSEVLNVERLGIHDNFFELGGHSLLAIKVISRLRQTLQIELPLSTLFEMPTVADLAGRIETIQWAVQASKASETETMDDYEEGEL